MLGTLLLDSIARLFEINMKMVIYRDADKYLFPVTIMRKGYLSGRTLKS
jgi:hypothetical protein